ncbi:Selenocystathionine beta-lyase / Cystathionine beta-lyase [Spironucleus salmonicida]|uniref:cysteine-S-conjugate beta-lyase n=1 Tax=Spironucleus salmonicida TaxID=348837 RepID=V6LWI7_9EUKA|nr:Selenocystathionine beta-lyase / Cystathionine beta-lyase [Spironucleus salmonicida]|eukprot:EST49002.1 Aminotransferase [Spironucleus salmonicida]
MGSGTQTSLETPQQTTQISKQAQFSTKKIEFNNPEKYDFEIDIDRSGTNSIKIEVPRDTFKNPTLISLGTADFEVTVPAPIQRAIQKRLDHPIHGYTRYSAELIKSVQDYYQRHHNMQLNQEDMFFTPGVVPAVALALRCVVNPGDAVCMMHPEYPPFYHIVEVGGYKMNLCHMTKTSTGFEFNFQQFEEQIKTSKAFLFSSPHNPTGTVLPKADMIRIVEICQKYNVAILFDEIWSDLVFSPAKHVPLMTLAQKNIFTFYAASKSFNIAGLHMSLAFTKDPELQTKFRLEQEKMHMTTSNVFGLVAMEAAYTQCDDYLEQFKFHISSNLRMCYSYFEKNMPNLWTYLPPSTTVLWIDFGKYFTSTIDAEQWCVDQGVYLQRGNDFCKCPDHIYMRINCGSPKKLLADALDKLFKGYQKLQLK